MPYRFAIFDDEEGEVAKLADYLTAAYPPPASKIIHRNSCADWDMAETVVAAIADSRDVVAFFDLNLLSGTVADAAAGLERVRSFRAQRKRWTVVGYSRFQPLADIMTDPDECFDGMISKQELHPMKRPARIAYVKEIVDDAIARHAAGGRLSPTDANIVDSFGMRVFRSTFGDATIDELLHNEAGAWRRPMVAALTSGHSGAHLLRLSHGRESLVLKVARTASIIDYETQAVTRNLSRLGPFNGKLAQYDSEKKTLSSGAVYYRQANVVGESALDRLTNRTDIERAALLQKLIRLCIETSDTYTSGRISGRAEFILSPIDRGRFETSTEFIQTLAKSLRRHKVLGISGAEMDRIVAGARSLVEGWESNRVINKATFLVLQHGDFNPGNVLITSADDLVLIDLARFTDWPPGYDLARLALLLRLRLLDRDQGEDWLPFNISSWLSERVASIGTTSRPAGSCAEAITCDNAFRRFVASARTSDRAKLIHGYRLGSLWDLVKVVSYQDASPFKRLWALVELERLAREISAIQRR